MKKIFMLLITCTIIIAGCQKQPVADFSFDKTTYKVGETILLTNNSIDADHYSWTMPDGQILSGENIQYTTNSYNSLGSLNFELMAFSRNDNKSDKIIKSVILERSTGDITFWMNEGSNIVTVTLNGNSEDITMNYASQPNCSTSGCANFNDLASGTYNFTATDGFWEWNGQVIINSNDCTTMQLTFSKAIKTDNPAPPVLKK
ncbi:MAG: hypothetical protein WCT85_01475 [Parachlamydiales bacterium]|jgi:hypothetical protein